MDFESLFAQTRWQILTLLSEKPLSPMEIAQKLPATISHASQQLKFLEAIGIVKKEKIVNRDKGKPRMLFSLSRDYAHLSLLVKGFSGKRLLPLNEHHKAILRIWFIDNVLLHRRLEKFYWDVEEFLSEIRSLLVDSFGNIVIIAEDEKIKSRLSVVIKQYSRDGMSCSVVNEKQFVKAYSGERFQAFFGDSISITKEVEK